MWINVGGVESGLVAVSFALYCARFHFELKFFGLKSGKWACCDENVKMMACSMPSFGLVSDEALSYPVAGNT